MNRRFKNVTSNLKAGVQWKGTGNVGDGEYYQNPSLAPNGYRPVLTRLIRICTMFRCMRKKACR